MRLRLPACLMAVCVFILVASTTRAATIVVPAGGDLQAALNAARPGDVVTLAPNAIYSGNFVLPNKGAITDYITIRSAASDAQLPPAGVRMTPGYAALLPKIKSPNSTWALTTAAGANHWKLMFLEFQANVNGYGDIIDLGAAGSMQTQLSQVPYALVLDRLYVHGDPVAGQKRGIALHSRDTDIVNSWVSECKAVGQEAQAISGFNGPGNYLIENNHLESATQNFLIGGADPTIPNLVTSNITFRYNYLTKPPAWMDPIVAAPAGVAAAAAPGAGSLAAGTYSYTVQARGFAGQTNVATSRPTVEVSATLAPGTTGAVVISWKPVAGAQDYVVWGRTAGGETMNWKTAALSFTDTGAAGTTEKQTSATTWLVKNIFELKNAQHVLVEGNVFEYNWVGGQPGYAILSTPRNQGGTARSRRRPGRDLPLQHRAAHGRRREHSRHRQRRAEPAHESHRGLEQRLRRREQRDVDYQPHLEAVRVPGRRRRGRGEVRSQHHLHDRHHHRRLLRRRNHGIRLHEQHVAVRQLRDQRIGRLAGSGRNRQVCARRNHHGERPGRRRRVRIEISRR